MRWICVAAVLLASTVARADCQSGIADAMRRANALPPSTGRAALLEQIQRAAVARHEDDQGECADQLAEATSVLDRIDAAKARAAASGQKAGADDRKP